jgi:hypothetical protein
MNVNGRVMGRVQRFALWLIVGVLTLVLVAMLLAESAE